MHIGQLILFSTHGIPLFFAYFVIILAGNIFIFNSLKNNYFNQKQ